MESPIPNPDPDYAPKSSDAPHAEKPPNKLHPDTIKRLLTRFRKYRLAVLEDRPHPGRAPVLTPEMRTTLLHCLRQADRAWTCAQLAELLHQQYGVQVPIETIRQFLRRAGFVWRRTRYVPAKRPNPQEYADACRGC